MDVLINIKGNQIIDGQDNITELTTVGKLECRDGKTYLRYEDSASMGVDGVYSVIKIDGKDTVTIQRTGDLQSRLYIRKGQRNICHYETACGNMELGIFGTSVKADLNDNYGKIDLRYTIDINHGLISENTIEITYKEDN